MGSQDTGGDWRSKNPANNRVKRPVQQGPITDSYGAENCVA